MPDGRLILDAANSVDKQALANGRLNGELRVRAHLGISRDLRPFHLLGLDEAGKFLGAAATAFCSIHAKLSCKASCATVWMLLPFTCAGATSDNLNRLGLAGHSMRQLLSHAGLPAWACRPPLQDDILWQPDRN